MGPTAVKSFFFSKSFNLSLDMFFLAKHVILRANVVLTFAKHIKVVLCVVGGTVSIRQKLYIFKITIT